MARTKRIPIEERARAAVIAWMRHNTTNYDHRYIPNVAGKRREVRHELAQESLAVLERYRRGEDAPPDCPLQLALEKDARDDRDARDAVQSPAAKSSGDSFWL